jgi:1,2-phenylacetyl-CoA epoxidase catalytic subunit
MSEPTAKPELDDATRLGLQTTVIALSDTKLLLGYHYGEWTFGPPAIEAGIAACSMAQEEFGHTRLFNRILKREFDVEIDPLNDTRAPQAFASIAFLDRAFESWADLVAANVVVDQALSLIISAFAGGGFDSIARIADKMLLEERFHYAHAEGWVRLMEEQGGAPREALHGSLSRAIRDTSAFFGPPAQDATLVTAELKHIDDDALRQRLLDRLANLLAEPETVGLTSGSQGWTLAEPLSWEDWDPARRRLDRGGPDAAILDELRGTKNVAFKTA